LRRGARWLHHKSGRLFAGRVDKGTDMG
jgi:hypothetical protein